MINEKENSVLLIAGFTQREINTQKQKFYNLFRIEPWLVPMRRHGEWVSLTDEEIDYWIGSNRTKKALCRAIDAALKEKNT